MVTVDGAIFREAVFFRQGNLRGDVSDRACDWAIVTSPKYSMTEFLVKITTGRFLPFRKLPKGLENRSRLSPEAIFLSGV